jgi:septal ring factor EnvC (AmiA/AmiB activator)
MGRITKLLLLALALTTPVLGQLPRTFYNWWSSPVAKDLKLTPDQQRQIRTTIRDYRARLTDLHDQIDRAEADLEYQFNQQTVNTQKATEAIDRLAGARSELTKTISRMSLTLRAVLTQEQWQELQRRRPHGGAAAPAQVETDHQRK